MTCRKKITGLHVALVTLFYGIAAAENFSRLNPEKISSTSLISKKYQNYEYRDKDLHPLLLSENHHNDNETELENVSISLMKNTNGTFNHKYYQHDPYLPQLRQAIGGICLPCWLIPTATILAAAAGVAVAVGVSVPLYASNNQIIPQPNFTIVDTCRVPVITEISSININDGCNSSSILFDDGFCRPLLRSCSTYNFWITVNITSQRGQCSPRLCGREKVFVPCDQLCHDIEDPSVCSGGRRLYYTAYGDTVCDCPMGQYIFPRNSDQCVALFTQGPCPNGQVVKFLDNNNLGCAPSECRESQVRTLEDGTILQFVRARDGLCYPLGTRGPCRGINELLAYDIIKKKVVCHDVTDPFSPYFESQTPDALLDQTFNQMTAEEFDQVQVNLLYDNNISGRNDTETRRQGVFQVPSNSATSLLNPCQSGDQSGKCANPAVPNMAKREVTQAVRAGFS